MGYGAYQEFQKIFADFFKDKPIIQMQKGKMF